MCEGWGTNVTLGIGSDDTCAKSGDARFTQRSGRVRGHQGSCAAGSVMLSRAGRRAEWTVLRADQPDPTDCSFIIMPPPKGGLSQTLESTDPVRLSNSDTMKAQ